MSKSAIIHSIKADIDEDTKQTLLQFLSISGTRCSETASLAMTLEENCPPALRSALSLWQDGSLYHFATLEETRKPANMATEVFLFSRYKGFYFIYSLNLNWFFFSSMALKVA
jgi:hypothetical protein